MFASAQTDTVNVLLFPIDMNTASSKLYNKHQQLLNEAIAALGSRAFYTPYPEHPKAYPPEQNEEGKTNFGRHLNENYEELQQAAAEWIGEEISPYWQTGLGIRYPKNSVDTWISNSQAAAGNWAASTLEERAGILIESLEKLSHRYFEMAYATMHTTGQSFMMAFQASGPHANDRALEAVAMGVAEMRRFPEGLDWIKPMGKFDLKIRKNWKSIPRGIGLVVGCSTFPGWNSVPGLYANLICGNTALVKPHPKAVLPIAMVVAELRNVLRENGQDPNVVQLCADTTADPVTVKLAEHPEVKLIDYTGGNEFGDYLEGLDKVVFTEKAGVNSVIIDSVNDLNDTARNIAFSASLYSGQMCTAPQNVFIPKSVNSASGSHDFEEVASAIKEAVAGIVNHPKMGAGTLGSIQNDRTINRIVDAGDFGGELILDALEVSNEEFENARIASPRVVVLDSGQRENYAKECFGPVIFLIRCKDSHEALDLAAGLAQEKGAITCLAFSQDAQMQAEIEDRMNKEFVPVSFNLTGAGFVNQHAAFSDFHVTGGNPSGNASLTNPEFINKRFVWVGNRYM